MDREAQYQRRRAQAVRRVISRRNLAPSLAERPLTDAYDVASGYLAPFITDLMVRMLPDLKNDAKASSGHRILFLDRDGRSLAIAARKLDPAFFRSSCVELTLSRYVVEAAIQSLEAHGAEYPQLESFRRKRAEIDPELVPNAFVRLNTYVQEKGVPVGVDGGSVTIVDMSFKGSLQELLNAIYPELEFNGRYACFGASPDDPHPGSKQGYAVHLDASEMMRGHPRSELPSDVELTFAHQDAVAALEDTLRGALSSTKMIDDLGPVQRSGSTEPMLSRRLQPGRIADRYFAPSIRDGVRSIVLMAVDDYAGRVSELQSPEHTWQDELHALALNFRNEVRRWIEGGPVDPQLQTFLDSFVSRLDDARDETWRNAVNNSEIPELPAQRPLHFRNPPVYDSVDDGLSPGL